MLLDETNEKYVFLKFLPMESSLLPSLLHVGISLSELCLLSWKLDSKEVFRSKYFTH